MSTTVFCAKLKVNEATANKERNNDLSFMFVFVLLKPQLLFNVQTRGLIFYEFNF